MPQVAALLLLVAACRFDPAGIGDEVAGDANTGDSPDSASEPPLGTGKDGELTVSDTRTINVYTSIFEGAGAGVTRVSVTTTTGFADGDLVMLHQPQGMPPEQAPSGDQTDLALDGTTVGRFQLVRLTAVDPGELVLAEPTAIAFGTGSQVVRVPELTRLIVDDGATLVAQPWDGTTGGVIAALVTGTVTIDGAIDASDAGFRGGRSGAPLAFAMSCAALDGTTAEGGGARKGEGVVNGRYELAGRGNAGPGAGGGNCHNAGGGGGGNGGTGGDGGGTYNLEEPLGGLGGSELVFDATTHLVFGGGGGAGEDNDDGADGQGGGGAGGGIVLLRGQAIGGGGDVISSGAEGVESTADGAGGGGAGGTVSIYAVDGIALEGLIARGGPGGGSSDAGGGGGGAGGRILVDAGGPLSTPLAVQGGAGGGGNPGLGGEAGVTDIR